MAYSDDLLSRYLAVCNKALDLNRDRFPFKQILSAAQEVEQRHKVELQIIGDRGRRFVLSFNEGHIRFEPHNDCGPSQCVRTWRVDPGYLEYVSQHPDVFIQNPARIDWEWMFDAA